MRDAARAGTLCGVRALSTPWLAVAVVGLSLTLGRSEGFYDQPTLVLLAVSVIAALLGVAGVSWPWGDDVPAPTGGRIFRPGATRALLVAGVIASAVALVTSPLGRYMADPRAWVHRDFLAIIVIAMLASMSVRATRRLSARIAGAVLVGALIWIGVWTIRQAPEPHIDVIPVHEDGFRAVARGQSPYGIVLEDIYRENEPFYAPEMRDGKRVLFGFPYPPLSLLLAWPGHAVFGDLRYSEVAAFALALVAILWLGFRPRADGAPTAEPLLCAGVLVLAPKLAFHIEQGWTEPFPIALIALTVATAIGRPRWTWLPLGLLIASKQHMVLALLFTPFLLGPSAGRSLRETIRATALLIAAALGVAIVVTLPLALLDPEAFWRSAVVLQLREPFRLDSLSFTRELLLHGWQLDKHGALRVSLGAGVLALVVGWWRAPRTPAGFSAALGLTCLLLAAFGKKAFLNYYFLVMWAFVVAMAAADATTASSTAGSSRPQKLA